MTQTATTVLKKSARRQIATCWLLLGLAIPAVARAQDTPPAPFNAAIAWASFTKLLGEDYAYFDRPGIEGETILAAFAPRAKAATTDKQFIDVLQLVAHNFVDPHFIVGPLDNDDWAVIPTSSDIFGVYADESFVVGEVRADSDASAKRVLPRMTIVRIDGKTPADAVAEIMGLPFASLDATRIAYGLNIALAGHRGQRRVIEMRDREGDHVFNLAPGVDQAKRDDAGRLLTVERHGPLGVIRINNSLGNNDLIAQFSTALATLADTSIFLIDLRDTPSGGNTTVARGIMGHFVTHDVPYQMHVIPHEQRVYGPTRKFVEYVAPYGNYYPGKVYVAGGHWTGSMGEGLMVGFDAIGATTIGTDLAHLLGALSNETIDGSNAKIDIGTEELFTVTSLPRAAYRPKIYLQRAERWPYAIDPVLSAIPDWRIAIG